MSDRRLLLQSIPSIHRTHVTIIPSSSLFHFHYQFSISRNFLLAKRLMKSLNCTAQSWPPLPDSSTHPLWQTWDLAAESCLFHISSLQRGAPMIGNLRYSILGTACHVMTIASLTVLLYLTLSFAVSAVIFCDFSLPYLTSPHLHLS
jgi:hypothetical protein